MYAFGHLTRDDHLRETGPLGGEAVLDGALIQYALAKCNSEATDHFRAMGRASSSNGAVLSPSRRAALAWSVASVVGARLPGAGTAGHSRTAWLPL